MDDNILIGDVEAWFEAFERGDFLEEWNVQHQALRMQFEKSLAQFDTTQYDASMD